MSSWEALLSPVKGRLGDLTSTEPPGAQTPTENSYRFCPLSVLVSEIHHMGQESKSSRSISATRNQDIPEAYFIKKRYLFLFYARSCYTCMCIACEPDARQGQKKSSELLELELQVVVSHHVRDRNKALGFGKGSQCS